MKALILERYGKSNQLAFAHIPRPTIQPDEILVQVHAAGLNPIDYMIPKGTFKAILKFKLPATMGSDLAGIVLEVGSRVTRFKPGDSVYASIFDLGTGALAEYAAVPESAAALKPQKLDFVQAASIPMVGLTAWQAFKEHTSIKPGQKVFIPAGSGGIGTFAIQLAKYLGAKVATTTSTNNVGLVQQLGADEIIDYKKQAFEQVLHGYDVVLGTVRGDGVEKALQVLKPNARVVSLVGPPDAAFARNRGMHFFMRFLFGLISRKMIRQARKRGIEYAFMFVHPDGQQLSEISKLMDGGHIQPVVDQVFSFDQTLKALAYLESGHAKGKVVVQLI
ncbi:NADP-dependent oxidoreductase [Methylophilus aquaticus]|uniref:NADP-dependent oxidoreductase n=1 Tax=Methylophilus aquaticus TaxID=1971610 RepID=A0ABT9JRP1_9PROT|nr:NADP-dependent oxidoreductase [Methylophilus aquaticus]MDP8567164.1 NADP-dependent oxidoreductase [Methylophilus aquaticus]